jgi:hypothetical protein
MGLVAHEHVWTRASCRLRLLSAPDAKAIEELLSALQGCVVTKAEHQRLKPFDATHEGWARSRRASACATQRVLLPALLPALNLARHDAI